MISLMLAAPRPTWLTTPTSPSPVITGWSTRTPAEAPLSMLIDDEKTLAPVGAGAVVKSEAAGAARERSARKAKEAATKRRDQPVKVERTGPVKFVRESVGELRKVVYPTGQQLINYFIVVLVFVLFIIAYVSLLDLGLGAAIFKLFS